MSFRPMVYSLLVMSLIGCHSPVHKNTPSAGIVPNSECQSPPVTEAEQFGCIVKNVHEDLRGVTEGKVATYIPALANEDPTLFGVAIVTVDGKVYTAGNSDRKFTMQSIAKVFTLALAMQDREDKVVLEKVGVEPTGMPFNSVLSLELEKLERQRSAQPQGSKQHRPMGNPLINPGALITVSLVNASSSLEREQKILDSYATFAGAKLALNQEVYDSESKTNHRNRGIAELLFDDGRLNADPQETVNAYTKQCSVEVTTTQLATMGATLANRGVNPFTKERAVDEKYVSKILSVMMMAGTYDEAGFWAWHIGLPAKTGVSGGILAVVPGRFAIAAFSPPLNQYGTSVRGALAIEHISKELGMNLFDASR